MNLYKIYTYLSTSLTGKEKNLTVDVTGSSFDLFDCELQFIAAQKTMFDKKNH